MHPGGYETALDRRLIRIWTVNRNMIILELRVVFACGGTRSIAAGIGYLYKCTCCDCWHVVQKKCCWVSCSSVHEEMGGGEGCQPCTATVRSLLGQAQMVTEAKASRSGFPHAHNSSAPSSISLPGAIASTASTPRSRRLHISPQFATLTLAREFPSVIYTRLGRC